MTTFFAKKTNIFAIKNKKFAKNTIFFEKTIDICEYLKYNSGMV